MSRRRGTTSGKRVHPCPKNCPCECHDTGGGSGHGLGPCPGKAAS